MPKSGCFNSTWISFKDVAAQDTIGKDPTEQTAIAPHLKRAAFMKRAEQTAVGKGASKSEHAEPHAATISVGWVETFQGDLTNDPAGFRSAHQRFDFGPAGEVAVSRNAVGEA